jgi:hypothetical protein
MIETILLVSAFLVFLVGPAIGVLMVAREVTRSRAIGYELDDLAQGLRAWVESLRSTDDPARAYANLSNWLEAHIRQIDTGWIQVCTRLLIAVGAIGFGEDSREAFRRDEDYRYQTLRASSSLIEAIEDGRVEVVMQRTADLLGLFLCYRDPQRAERIARPIDPAPELRKTLLESARLMEAESIHASDVINSALHKIATQGDPSTVGIPLLVLKWVQLRVWDAPGTSRRKSKPFSDVLADLANEVVQISNAYASGDLTKTARIIYTEI